MSLHMDNKIIRSICHFTDNPSQKTVDTLTHLQDLFQDHGYIVQTTRMCTPYRMHDQLIEATKDKPILLGIGSMFYTDLTQQYSHLDPANNVSYSLDLSDGPVEPEHVDFLYRIITECPDQTFNFTYGFNLPASSPYFPSAIYEKNGFSIGLQPTDLTEGCKSLEDWLLNLKYVWQDISELLSGNEDFLGIDSSIAPMYEGKSSLVNFIHRLGYTFSDSTTTDIYTRITRFIKTENPKPVGLCGLMIPCLEDFELADEYDAGNFSIERNIYLSLHSGVGIDVYPIGVDEGPQRVLDILRLVQALSNKYSKSLSARFVSDGKARIGERTNFQNEYLKDVVVKKI